MGSVSMHRSSGWMYAGQPKVSDTFCADHEVTQMRPRRDLNLDFFRPFLIFLCRQAGLDLSAHPRDRTFRNCRRNEKRFARHPIVTLLVVGRNTALIAEEYLDLRPVDLRSKRLVGQQFKQGLGRASA